MEELIHRFRELLDKGFEHLHGLTDAAASLPVAPGKWSRKQIVGHLIDSASNNHQRFVRVALEDNLSLPGYDQDGWVDVQRYAEERWDDVLALWHRYNVHLLHIMATASQESLEHMCQVEGDAPVTLRLLMEDYVRHLKHHLKQMID